MFYWLNKPRMFLTPLDEFVIAGELIVVVMVVAAIYGWWDMRRVAKIKKVHGPHCTCWTCMGVTR